MEEDIFIEKRRLTLRRHILANKEKMNIDLGTMKTNSSNYNRIIKQLVDHPSHYGGKDNPYEAIKVIEAWDLGFCLGNVVKYISRAGKKTNSPVEDLKKAMWYLEREISKNEQQG